jgi:hypothetical protein
MNSEWQAVFDEFREAGRRFIGVVDSREESSREQFLERVEKCLAKLHVYAIQLPNVEPATANGTTFSFPTDAWWDLFNQLREKLGDCDIYWCMFNSTKYDEPVCGSLADDIADIYRDLTKSLDYANQNAPDADVIWEMRYSFTSHWGEHVTSALKAIFDLRSNGTLK